MLRTDNLLCALRLYWNHQMLLYRRLCTLSEVVSEMVSAAQVPREVF